MTLFVTNIMDPDFFLFPSLPCTIFPGRYRRRGWHRIWRGRRGRRTALPGRKTRCESCWITDLSPMAREEFLKEFLFNNIYSLRETLHLLFWASQKIFFDRLNAIHVDRCDDPLMAGLLLIRNEEICECKQSRDSC